MPLPIHDHLCEASLGFEVSFAAISAVSEEETITFHNNIFLYYDGKESCTTSIQFQSNTNLFKP